MHKAETPRDRTSPMTADQQRLAADNISLVHKAATAFLPRVDRSIEFDELVYHGMIGLVAAARNFNPSLGTPFHSYAYPHIDGAIYSGLRSSSWYTRKQQQRFRDNQRVEERLEQVRLEQANMTDTLEVLAQSLQSAPPVQRVSMDEAAGAVAPGSSPESVVHLIRVRERIAEAAEELKTVERQLLEAYYVEGQSLEEAAARLGHKKPWAHGVLQRVVKSIRESFGRSDG
jgi:RNA polymerase sigma factor for flagellar operon FliA